MEAVISAISGEILSRFISFLIKKHTDRASVEDKLERLQHLLLRIHTVVEEAEGRHITNSKMLLQLRMLVSAMYQGYYVLDTLRYKPVEEISNQKQVTTPTALSNPLKRTRSAYGSLGTTSVNNDELQAAVDKLETVVANTTEFIILLGACKRMHKRPYDSYLYIDNFMFSRLVEKQELINSLLQETSVGAPDVIPVIGSYRVGKKSLVGFACNSNAVCSHFSSVLHLKSNNFWRVSHETFMHGRTLFKVLAFGSTDPDNHPQLASIAMELALNIDGLLLVANMLADLLRKNQNVQFWFHVLKRYRNSLDRNFSLFGDYPRQLLERDCSTDITMLVPSTSGPLHLMPSYEDSSSFYIPRNLHLL